MKFSTISTAFAVLASAVSAAPVDDKSLSLNPRWLKGGPICGQVAGNPVPNSSVFLSDVAKFRSEWGKIGCGVAPHSCSTMFCGQGIALYLCSDSGSTITVPCAEIADVAESIYSACAVGSLAGGGWKGQRFDTTLWNVVANAGLHNECNGPLIGV
ncbi:hypothetical protein TWF694_004546 [Orbilia ellipsospora]|uniref:Uncharacterized protein n=1 Tax=Orbilia ellipsospora TaxID=2528407 RepID=A0AAV9WVN6_9PEZI